MPYPPRQTPVRGSPLITKTRRGGTSRSPTRTDGGEEEEEYIAHLDADTLERKRLTLPYLDKLEYVRLQLSMRGVGEPLPMALTAAATLRAEATATAGVCVCVCV